MNEGWSIKLQVNGGGVPLFNEWELVYKAAQTGYKLTQGKMSITGQEPAVITHQSDSTAAVLARAIEQNKVLALEISILDNVHTAAAFDWDVALNNVHTLARHLSGASSTAVRSASGGQNVRIAIKPDTATNTTYYDVQWGKVDTSAAYYTAEGQAGSTQVGTKGAWFCPVTLTLKDGGYGDSFTLRNDLPSSPHMIEDSNADGLADGLTLVGAPTATIATNRYLVGGKSQKLTTDNASNQGIQTDTVTTTAGTAVVGYVDLNLNGDRVSVILRDDVGIIQTKTITENNTPATASRSYVDPFGAVFYRIELSGVTTAASTNCYLQVRRVVGDATQVTQIWIDKIYLQTGATTVPSAFCSSSNLKNRNDPAATTAATRQQINYLDVWGVPGDLPAYMKTVFDLNSSTSASAPIFAKRVTGGQLSSRIRHFFDSSLFDITAPNAWTNAVDASRIGGSYITCLVTDAVNPRYTSMTLASSETPYFAQLPLRMYAIVRADNAAARFSVLFGAGISEYAYTSDNFAPAAINTWSIVDCGIVNLTGLFPDPSTSTGSIVLTIYGSGSAGNMLFDGIYFLPVDEILIHPLRLSRMSFVTNGATKEVLSSLDLNREYWNAGAAGSLYEIIPAVENRIICVTKGTVTGLKQEEQLLTTTMAATLTVTPRTSHLLGTA